MTLDELLEERELFIAVEQERALLFDAIGRIVPTPEERANYFFLISFIASIAPRVFAARYHVNALRAGGYF